jgi:RHS repeat-associated protein
MNLNGDEYFYLRNIQGDITGLVDPSGAEVVSYQYNTWGELVSISGSLAETVGEKNPYRYRGYRYDSETGLYYLNARYYNPEWKRFLNADTFGEEVGDLLSHNVFAYVKNNQRCIQIHPVTFQYTMIRYPIGYGGIQAMTLYHG